MMETPTATPRDTTTTVDRTTTIRRGEAVSAELHSQLKLLEEVAADPDRRDIWETWATFLLQEQSALASREKPFTSVFLQSGALEACVVSVLSAPLNSRHEHFFLTVLKSTLVNGTSAAEGQPDLVDHLQARLQQLSLFFHRQRRKCAVDSALDEPERSQFHQLSRRVSSIVADAIAALRKPLPNDDASMNASGASPDGKLTLGRHSFSTSSGGGNNGTFTMSQSSHSRLFGSMHSDGAVGTPTGAKSPSIGYSPMELSLYNRRQNVSTTCGGPVSDYDLAGTSLDSSALDATPPVTAEGNAIDPAYSLSVFLKNGSRCLSVANHRLSRIELLLNSYQDRREADGRMRQDIAAEKSNLKDIGREISEQLNTTKTQQQSLKNELAEMQFQRKRDEERVACQVQEQEEFLVTIANEKLALETRLRHLTKISREARETMGILRGRRKSLAPDAPNLPPAMITLQESIKKLENWASCLAAQAKCSAGCVSFLNGLEQESAHCSATALETEESSLNQAIGGAATASIHVMEHQLAFVRKIIDVRTELQHFQTTTAGVPSTAAATSPPSSSVGAIATTGTAAAPPEASVHQEYYKKLLRELADEAVRQGAVAEDQLNALEELSLLWSSEQLPDVFAAGELRKSVERANTTYKTITDEIEIDGSLRAGHVTTPAPAAASSGATPPLGNSSSGTPREPSTTVSPGLPALTASAADVPIGSTPPSLTPPTTTAPSLPAAVTSTGTPTTGGLSTPSSPPSAKRKLGLPTKLKSKSKSGSARGAAANQPPSMSLARPLSTNSLNALDDEGERRLALARLPSALQLFLLEFTEFDRATASGRTTPPSFDTTYSGEI